MLKFDFSGMLTESKKALINSFSTGVSTDIQGFFSAYKGMFDREDLQKIIAEGSAAGMLRQLWSVVRESAPGKKIYILIDEYDHFANELIAFHLDTFKESVSRNGFVRKFFEVIKEATGEGLVDRMFVTGVSPVTLDSLTSGFNIGKKISLEPDLHDMMGFTQQETSDLLSFAGVPDESLPKTLEELSGWYNGYLFHPDARNRLYNPNMLIYFGDHYQQYGKYPEKLLDENIASDYSKIRRMLESGGQTTALNIQEEVLEKGWVRASLTIQFTFDRLWVKDDFTSLLF